MARLAPNTWWHRNHLSCWNYPTLPTKKELIYRVFRAAYPEGAFVDDNLTLTELRDKDVIWNRLAVQINGATDSLHLFLNVLFEEEPRLRTDQEKQKVLHDYYVALLNEARNALFISQNGRYLEFRCMEELLVRYRKADMKTWMNEPEPGQPRFQLPRVEGFQFAQEHLDLQLGSNVTIQMHRLHRLHELESTE
ncbi:hypothetical protein F4818DRAFT_414748 [Hypoxylon cercidicola]|nr:hypothetical protein F4818DRAFT_414748 [Hypoxylon cercidicola]